MKKKSKFGFIKILNNKKGLTLVELIIAVIFLTIVMGVASSMFFSGNSMFKKGVDQYDLQSSIRLTSDFIVNKVRNVSEISLVAPASPQTYDQIYLDAKCIVYKPAGGAVVNKTDAIINSTSDVSFSLVPSGSKYMLIIKIKGSKGTNTYDINTKIFLNNVQTATANNNKTIIYFKK